MRFGFYLPVRGPLASYDGVVETALHGERLGFHSATIADHIVFPTATGSKYPYAASGIHPSHGDALEQLSLMAFVAGKTERLRLVTSVTNRLTTAPEASSNAGGSLLSTMNRADRVPVHCWNTSRRW